MRKYYAEFLGTFALVFMGCASAVIAGKYIGFEGIAFTFGITLLVMVYAIGWISGCHINPAVTISMLLAGKIKGQEALGYIIVQCLGAIVAAGLLLGIASGLPGYSLGTNGLGQNGYGSHSPAGYDMTSAFLAEVVLTFLFLLVIHAATSEDAPKGFAGIAIGFTLFAIHLVAIPIDGTSVNPARSLGPALWVGGAALDQLWLFIVAPIIGGILAAVTWMYVLKPEAKPSTA
ncbi:MAG: aquaporin Z [Candidatus Thermoplasmatota archaeon]|jgi:aquaporin Z|nr:aquaporin Z [Candidatus Thermoplasmatota archaeon]MCL5984780.1 aquaporin Z [Candidatus Thermoplasmatota archaeon]